MTALKGRSGFWGESVCLGVRICFSKGTEGICVARCKYSHTCFNGEIAGAKAELPQAAFRVYTCASTKCVCAAHVIRHAACLFSTRCTS